MLAEFLSLYCDYHKPSPQEMVGLCVGKKWGRGKENLIPLLCPLGGLLAGWWAP